MYDKLLGVHCRVRVVTDVPCRGSVPIRHDRYHVQYEYAERGHGDGGTVGLPVRGRGQGIGPAYHRWRVLVRVLPNCEDTSIDV